MKVIESGFGEIRILKKQPDGYAVAKQPSWGQLQIINIVVGKQNDFLFGDCIKNAVQAGRYIVETADYPNGDPIEDSQLSDVVQIPDDTQPIVHVDASNVTVSANDVINIYFRLIHVAPNRNSDSYRSMWTHLTIVSQEKADKQNRWKLDGARDSI